MLSHCDRDNNIIHQDDDARFSIRDEDTFIIRTLTADSPSPVFVTADVSQQRVPEERLALREGEMSVVFFKAGFFDLTFHKQAIKVLWCWPSLVTECSRARVPTAFEVTP